MAKIKLIMFDVDGSLKVRGEKIQQETLEIIKKIQQLGILCSVVTGGGFLPVLQSIRGFRPNTYMIVEEGRITDHMGDDIFRQEFSDVDIHHLRNIFNRNKLLFAAFAELENHVYRFYVDTDVQDDVLKKYNGFVTDFTISEKVFFEWIRAYGCVKVTVKSEAELEIPLDATCHKNESYYHVLSMDMDKGVAVETLANIVGVKHDEIMIVGNDFNDIPMFEKDFGIRLAVGDCPDELLERCTHQIDDVHVLHRFLESHFL